MIVELTASSATERYRSKDAPSLGRLKTGDVAMVFLKARKACSQVSSLEKGSVFLSSLENGFAFSASFGRNLHRGS